MSVVPDKILFGEQSGFTTGLLLYVRFFHAISAHSFSHGSVASNPPAIILVAVILIFQNYPNDLTADKKKLVFMY